MKFILVSMDNATYQTVNKKGETVPSRSVEVYLAECIANEGHEITLIINQMPYWEEGEQPKNLKVIVADVNGTIDYNKMDEILSDDYNLAFATSVSGARIVNFIGRKKNIPSVSQVLDIPEWRLSDTWPKIGVTVWKDQWDDYLKHLKESDHIIVNTDPCMSNLLKRGFSPFKISKVFYGMDCGLADKTKELDVNVYDIFYVCRLVWYKGAEYLMMALAMLKNEGIIPRVAIIGTGQDLQRLIEFREMFGLNNINFLGAIGNDKKFEVIKSSKIGVIPEICNEIGSIVPYEGIYCKKSVICFDLKIHKERAGKYPHYVEPFDTKAMAEKIKELLSGDKPDEKRLQEGYEFIKNNRSFASTTRELLKVFKKILEKWEK